MNLNINDVKNPFHILVFSTVSGSSNDLGNFFVNFDKERTQKLENSLCVFRRFKVTLLKRRD